MPLRSKTHYGAKALKQAYFFAKNLLFSNVNSIEQASPVSHKNYKVNYDRCLGSGVFSCVYEISPRPEVEKNFLANHCPYVYDYLYPTSSSNPSSTQYCVKVYKTAFRISLEYVSTPHKAVLYPLISFFNPYLDDRLNEILQKHDLTKMVFVRPRGFYSQFKTLVRGNTFAFYVENNFFVREDQFEFRKAFVEFLRSIKKAPLIFYDIYAANVMYDMNRQRWEIIDGYVKEAKNTDYTRNNFLKDLMRKASLNEATNSVLKHLNLCTEGDAPYTICDDKIVMTKILAQKYQIKTGKILSR